MYALWMKCGASRDTISRIEGGDTIPGVQFQVMDFNDLDAPERLMAMLGGTYIFGGRGTILGTFLAAWLLVVAATGMTVANLLPAVQLTVLGILLIVSIIATNFIYSRTQR